METTAEEEQIEMEIDESSSEEKIKTLEEKLKSHRGLPTISENLLNIALEYCESIEKAEELLVNFHYARQNIRKVFGSRHPGSIIGNAPYSAVVVSVLTNPDSEDWIIFTARLVNSDPKRFSIYQTAKLIFSELDILLQKDSIKDKKFGLILDLAGMTLEHIQIVTRFAASKILHLCRNAFPIHCGPILLLNPPEGISILTDYLAPFDFHFVEKLEDLEGFLPKEYLPSDLGGHESNLKLLDFEENYLEHLWCHGSQLAFDEIITNKLYMERITIKPQKKKSKKKNKKKKKKKKQGGKKSKK